MQSRKICRVSVSYHIIFRLCSSCPYKEEIYEILNQLIEKGLSIIMVSSELPELLGTCDRIMVMNEGKQTGLFDIEECSEETLMTFATN